MTAEQQKTKGNFCFRLKDYAAAVEHYSAALCDMDSSDATHNAPLRLALLTNRSLALHRLGWYAAAAADAEAVLQRDHGNTKAALRAAAAQLMAGDGAAAAQHAQQLVQCGGQAAGSAGSGATPQPAAWAAIGRHATALAAHQRRLAAADGKAAAVPEVEQFLEALAGEAEGEGETACGPAALLHQLAALLGADSRQQGGCLCGATTASSDAEEAAVALEGHPQGTPLLLFFLGDPDPATRQAAASALRAASLAAGGGGAATVLWPARVWQRLAALGTGAGGGEVQQAALSLLSWAAQQDAWVREQLLLHPLPAPGSGGQAPGAAPSSPAIVAQVARMLAQPATLHQMAPAAAQAAAELLQQYATDAAAAEALAQLGCQPLLALLRAARQAEGMAAFRPPGEAAGDAEAAAAGCDAVEGCAPSGGDSGSGVRGLEIISTISARGGAAAASISAAPTDPEQEALEALRAKLRKVFIAELVALQRCLLAAACQLASASRDLLLSEAVVEQGSGGGGPRGKRGIGAGPFMAELLELARELHGQQPRRTAAVLGPDGNPKAYAKRRFAADFKDNPAGDFLLSADLQQSSSSGGGTAADGGFDAGSTASPSGQPAQPTLFEMGLALLLATAVASPTAAALLHRRDVLGLCEELCSYCTHAVVSAAQQIVAAVADRVPAAAEEVVHSGQPPALAALLLCSTSQTNRERALDKLAAVADTCSGDDFAGLTGTTPGAGAGEARASAAYGAWQLLVSAGGGSKALPAAPAGGGSQRSLPWLAHRFLLRCCERAQRQQRLGPQVPPRGGCWDAVGRPKLQELLRNQAAKPGGQKEEEEEAAFSQLKRGFFCGAPHSAAPAKPPLPPRPAAAPAAAQAGRQDGGQGSVGAAGAGSKEGHAYKQGTVVIEELVEQKPAAAPAVSAAHTPPQRARPATQASAAAGAAAAAPQPQAAVAMAAEQEAMLAHHQREAAAEDVEEEEQEEEIADLRDVFDSSASLAAEQRRARAEWIALPLDKKLRWTQTSLDVSLHLLLPPGTRAADLQVSSTADRLAVRLRWYGAVLEGQLHLRVKPSETHWCLEDREVHVLLAKAEADAWWKKLLEGGEERGYRQLLQEAVDADEPVKPFEQLDDESRRLLEAIQERQAYIQAGLVDPEGFDDFRVVIGESGLRPSQA